MLTCMILLYYTLTRAIVWEGRVIMQRPQIKRLLVREVAETRGMSLDDVSRYSGESILRCGVSGMGTCAIHRFRPSSQLRAPSR